jgi:hypothetical protein
MCKVYIYQWWTKSTIIKTGGIQNEHELTHIIDGELITIRIRRRCPEIVDVQDPLTDTSLFTKQLRSKLLYEPVMPDQLKMAIYYSDGTSSDILEPVVED